MVQETKDSDLKEELVKAIAEINSLKEENSKLNKLLRESDSVSEPSLEEPISDHDDEDDSPIEQMKTTSLIQISFRLTTTQLLNRKSPCLEVCLREETMSMLSDGLVKMANQDILLPVLMTGNLVSVADSKRYPV